MKHTAWKWFLVQRFFIIMIFVAFSEKLLNILYDKVVYPWMEHTLHINFFMMDLESEQTITLLLRGVIYLAIIGICSYFPDIVGIGIQRISEQLAGNGLSGQIMNQTQYMSRREMRFYLLGMVALTILIIITLILPYIIAAIAFSRMIEIQIKKLEEQEQEQREEYNRRRNLLLSDVAHDLKTPMTAVAGYAKALLEEVKTIPEPKNNKTEKIEMVKEVRNHEIEMIQESNNYKIEKIETRKEIRNHEIEILKKSNNQVEQEIKGSITERQKEYLETIYGKSMQISDLLNLLFEYVKLDSEGFQLKKTKEDVWELLRECIANLYMDFEENGMEIFPEIPEEEIWMQIDKVQFQRVISNLLNNVIRHNPTGTKVLVKAEQEDEIIMIRICDNGTLIPKETAKYIFDPFVMGDESRSSKKGSGLGLSIAQKVISMHGGSLLLEQEEIGIYTKAFVIRLDI